MLYLSATNFDMRINKKVAEYLIYTCSYQEYNFSIMCREAGQDEDWQEVNVDDLDDNNLLDEDYKTFEVWLPLDKQQSAKARDYIQAVCFSFQL